MATRLHEIYSQDWTATSLKKWVSQVGYTAVAFRRPEIGELYVASPRCGARLIYNMHNNTLDDPWVAGEERLIIRRDDGR